jgi:hypothetical protein
LHHRAKQAHMTDGLRLLLDERRGAGQAVRSIKIVGAWSIEKAEG